MKVCRVVVCIDDPLCLWAPVPVNPSNRFSFQYVIHPRLCLSLKFRPVNRTKLQLETIHWFWSHWYLHTDTWTCEGWGFQSVEMSPRRHTISPRAWNSTLDWKAFRDEAGKFYTVFMNITSIYTLFMFVVAADWSCRLCHLKAVTSGSSSYGALETFFFVFRTKNYKFGINGLDGAMWKIWPHAPNK